MAMLLRRPGTRRRTRAERGAALVCALLCMTLLLALALALLLSTTTDTLISASYRSSGEAFFAADGGVAVGRRAMARALSDAIIEIRDGKADPFDRGAQILPDSRSTPGAPFFRRVVDGATAIANDEARSSFPNDSKYQIEVVAFEGGPEGGAARDPKTGVERYAFTYVIKSTGRSARGARAEVVERGELHTQLAVPTRNEREPFSKYGTFFDVGDPGNKLVLVSGTFSGPVHTNSHLSFSGKNKVVFRDGASQVDDYVLYDGKQVGVGAVAAGEMSGVTVSAGQYTKTSRVDPPKNTYSQELAVIEPSGVVTDPVKTPIDATGHVTAQGLANNLTGADGKPPAISGSHIAPGVYVGSDGAEVTGGGVYVEGNAQIALSTHGTTQIIEVTQNATTTTVTIDYAQNKTVIATPSNSYSFIGVPKDATLGPAQTTPGMSLFVDGSVTALSGPPAVDGATGPAISSQTAMTITAQRDITITGDLKYAVPVVNPDGTPGPGASMTDSMALGLFTNDGNVQLDPDPARTDGNGKSLEIDAAVAAFDSNAGNNNGRVEGTIVYTGRGGPGSASRLKLVGCRLQSNMANIKYKSRQVFYDPRLAGGHFAPPFYPGITVKQSPVTGPIEFGGEQAVRVFADSWQRDVRRKKKADA